MQYTICSKEVEINLTVIHGLVGRRRAVRMIFLLVYSFQSNRYTDCIVEPTQFILMFLTYLTAYSAAINRAIISKMFQKIFS